MFTFFAGLLICLLICIFVVTQPIIKPVANFIERDHKDKLRKHIAFLSEQVSRGHNDEGLKQSAQYIKEQMQQWSQHVVFQEFRVAGKDHQNVLCHLGPETKECIIIGAHYDSFDGLPGADDNASAVAGLLEIGRMLSEVELSVNIQLVAFTLEEPPYFRTTGMGSYQHANEIRQQDRAVKLMVCLEMIGYFSDAAHSQEYPLPILKGLYPRVGNFIALVGGFRELTLIRQFKSAMISASPLPVFSITAPSFIPGIDFSDHQNYWRFKIPAIMVTDTAFYRNPHYHTNNDTIEKLDFTRMNQVVNGVYKAVLVTMEK